MSENVRGPGESRTFHCGIFHKFARMCQRDHSDFLCFRNGRLGLNGVDAMKAASDLLRLIFLFRLLVFLFLPVMILLQSFLEHFEIHSIFIFPFFVFYMAAVAGYHMSILNAKCPFGEHDFRIRESRNNGIFLRTLFGKKCVNCGKSLEESGSEHS